MDCKLKAESLTDKVYNILKEKIASKQYPPGMRLIDSQLAKEYGISRTPLRSAIKKLQEDGLVICSSKGYFVYQPQLEDINEALEIRKIIDIAAATKLINEILPNDMDSYAEFERIYTDFKANVENEGFIKADEDFHDKVVLMTGNKLLYRIYIELRNQFRYLRRKTCGDKKRVEKACNHHEKIIKGILNFDVDATVVAITDHIDLSIEYAMEDYG